MTWHPDCQHGLHARKLNSCFSQRVVVPRVTHCYGCVLSAVWELLTSRTAFSGLHYGAIIERVALMGERPSVPSGAPEDYALLMCSCWSADPEQRPTFDQVRAEIR